MEDIIDLLFVHYKQSDIPIDGKFYVNNALIDLELYAPSIYQQMMETNNLEYYKTYISQRFQNILNILHVLDPKTRTQYLEQLKNETNFQFENYIDFHVPYELIIKRIPIVSNGDWNAYLDIETLLDYDNFSLEQYFLTLFTNTEIQPIHKILIILKGIYISRFKNDFYDFIVGSKSLITKTDASGNYNLNLIEPNNHIDINILNSILTKDPSNNFIFQLYRVDKTDMTLFFDAVCYHYLSTDYVQGVSNIYERLKTDLTNSFIEIISSENNIWEEYGFNFDSLPFNKTLFDRLYTHPIYLINNFQINTNLFSNDFDFKIFSYDDQIVTMTENDILDTLNDLLDKNSTDSLLESLELNEFLFQSLNIDPEILLNKIILTLSYPQLFIFINHIKNISYRESFNNYFTKPVVDFIFFKVKSNNIYQNLITLLNDNKIDLTGLYYILSSLGLYENISLQEIGLRNPLDRIMDVDLNLDLFLVNLKQKISTYSIQLFNSLPPSNEKWKEVLMKNKLFEKYINNESEGWNEKLQNHINSNIKTIDDFNYQGFIDLFMYKKIQNPLELMHFMEEYDFFDEKTVQSVLTILKSLNQLSKYFYKNWIDSLRRPTGLGYESHVPVVITNLIESEILPEDDVFDFMDVMDDPKIFIKQLSFEYTFKKDIKEYRFYKDFDMQKTPIAKQNGFTTYNNSSNNFIPIRSENMGNILNEIFKNQIELEANARTNKIVQNATNEIDVTKIYNEMFNKIVNEQKQIQDSERDLSDREIQEFIENKSFRNLNDYLKKISKDKGKDIDAWVESINARVMSTQIILSNIDPLQVMTDALFEDLINNGILQDFIGYYKVKMETNTFPSFYMAYHIINQLGSRYFERKNKELLDSFKSWSGKIEIETPAEIERYIKNYKQINEVSLQMLFVNDKNQSALDEMLIDFENIMKDENEKGILLKNAYISTLMFTKFIHNNNDIIFNPDFRISNQSEYKINMYAGTPKITANKGGDGMIVIEKN